MSSDATPIKVVILDDDLKLPTLSWSDGDLTKILNDDTSPEFELTKKFLEKNEITETGDLDELLRFINSSEFIEQVVQREDYKNLFEEGFKYDLLALLEKIEEKFALFQPFFKVFGDETKFTLEKRTKRPNNPNELAGYEVIIMDIMMDDHLDNDFSQLATYLGEIHHSGNSPAIFLISSRDELEDEKRMFRKEAKISSLSFWIMRKSAELMLPSAEVKIRLAFEQMQKCKPASEALAGLTKQFEEAIVESADLALKTLWSLDYPYLQQMHACAERENVPFSEHLLSACSSILLTKLESNQPLMESINALEGNLSGHKEKYCSFSKEAEIAMHDMEAALHFTGKPVDDLRFSPVSLNMKEDIGRLVVRTLPFGLVLLKPPVTIGSSSLFREGAEALINCTQQCDLSRNIIEPGTNLVFVQALLVKSPVGNGYCIPLPTSADNGSRWWLAIDEKKIHAKSFYEFLRQFDCMEFVAISQARDSVVRQIRERLFQNMSRTEEAVKAGHNNMFYVDLITLQGSESERRRFMVNDEVKQVLLYEFPNDKNKTFHLLDQDHVEVINWLIDSSEHLKGQLSSERLEAILKDGLPRMEKKVAISAINFAIKESPNYDIQNKLVNQQTPVAVVFAQTEHCDED